MSAVMNTHSLVRLPWRSLIWCASAWLVSGFIMVIVAFGPTGTQGIARLFVGIPLVLISIATLTFVAAASPNFGRTTSSFSVVAIVLHLIFAAVFFWYGFTMLADTSPYWSIVSISDLIIGAGLMACAGSLVPRTRDSQADVPPAPVISALTMYVVSMLIKATAFYYPPVSIWLFILAAATVIILVVRLADRLGRADLDTGTD